MKIAILDTYYPDALKAMPLGNGSYQEELDKVLGFQFGTSDFYSREFRKIGWDALDIIANHEPLQRLWKRENKVNPNTSHIQTALRQIEEYNPDIVFVQDLSFFDVVSLGFLSRKYLLVAQCSCALTETNKVKAFHTIFTSFPHFVPKLKALGVNAVYMPLAFHESVLTEPVKRDIDVSFVGGLGWQWVKGREVLDAVAREIPTFQWWGYGADRLPDGPLKEKYRGPAWGRDMYSIYKRSKIVINRHGEIAGNYANNMRMYEATGCGAALVTELKDNLLSMFEYGEMCAYDSPSNAVGVIRLMLEHWQGSGVDIAKRGQNRTLAEHTYAHRIPKIAEVLTEALQTA